MLPGHGRLSASRTVSHGQRSGKISIAAKLFGERAPKITYIPWYLVPGIQVPGTAAVYVVPGTCFVFQGATFCGQLLLRELSLRWVGIISHLH